MTTTDTNAECKMLILPWDASIGCFFFVGAGLPGAQRPHHKSVFDFDERALMIGASVFVNIVRSHLKK